MDMARAVANTRVNGDGQEAYQATPDAAVAAEFSDPINSKTYTTTGVNDDEVKNISAAAAAAAIVDAEEVPRSETPVAVQNKALQVVPESETAAHITPLETPIGEDLPKRSNRPEGHRTDSIVTISNLDIPGQFPKGGSTANGSTTNATA
ncbi:hypothetical protein LMH87_005830 [Akanthomyces muscarius]|uniref:Uncharacterized protein n=1 Tax=Akanthomyces muscarius TaxID=2231603 RepID=A0A9W8QMP1_AKAMU|nr:hypothetical protein LMH87_005830 [Akanthomyces muscarius]KAJ4164145.1 hypothetical protein LMH87_005830 [Akanthomyces muscarius]